MGEPLVLVGIGIVLALVVVFLLAIQSPARARSRPSTSTAGFPPVILALGLFLAAGSLGFGFDALAVAPVMLIIGLVLLGVSAFCWLQLMFVVDPTSTGVGAQEGQQGESANEEDGGQPRLRVHVRLGHEFLDVDGGEHAAGKGEQGTLDDLRLAADDPEADRGAEHDRNGEGRR